jgi:hypothetical protein
MIARSATLQTKAGYINARPPPPDCQNLLATHGRTLHWGISVFLTTTGRVPFCPQYLPWQRTSRARSTASPFPPIPASALPAAAPRTKSRICQERRLQDGTAVEARRTGSLQLPAKVSGFHQMGRVRRSREKPSRDRRAAITFPPRDSEAYPPETSRVASATCTFSGSGSRPLALEHRRS